MSDWRHWKKWYQINEKLKKQSNKTIILNSKLQCPICHSRNVVQLLNPYYIHCLNCGREFKLTEWNRYW